MTGVANESREVRERSRSPDLPCSRGFSEPYTSSIFPVGEIVNAPNYIPVHQAGQDQRGMPQAVDVVASVGVHSARFQIARLAQHRSAKVGSSPTRPFLSIFFT